MFGRRVRVGFGHVYGGHGCLLRCFAAFRRPIRTIVAIPLILFNPVPQKIPKNERNTLLQQELYKLQKRPR